MVFVDTESHGLVGATILIQYSYGEQGAIHVHNVFRESKSATLTLLEELVNNHIIGFNLSHDIFHLTRTYNVLLQIEGEDVNSVTYLQAEAKIRDENIPALCYKPIGVTDLMIVGRRSKLQATMGRKPIRIRKFPKMFAEEMVEILKEQLHFPPIYFARTGGEPVWKIKYLHGEGSDKKKGDEVTDVTEDTTIDQHFINIVLNFAPSTSLKNICKYILNFTDTEDTPIPKGTTDAEQYFPLGGVDPKDLDIWINHWEREYDYAYRDIVYTKAVWEWLGRPTDESTDSALTVLVANNYWAGFGLDQELIETKLKEARVDVEDLASRINVSAPKQVKEYIQDALTPFEAALVTSTSKEVLNAFANGVEYKGTEVQKRAEEVLAGRTRKIEFNLLDKLNESRRLYATYKVSGTLSNRMAGGSGVSGKSINPQGIGKGSGLRACFTFKTPEWSEELSGGDFDSMEVGIMSAVYNDPLLAEELQSGKSFHALLGAELFSRTYDEIKNDELYYGTSKSCTFSMAYGAAAPKLAEIMSRTGQIFAPSEVQESIDNFDKKYAGIYESKQRLNRDHSAIVQRDNGYGFDWVEPVEYTESLLGFRRYFTAEYQTMKVLFDLVGRLPKHWGKMAEGVTLWRTGKEVEPTSGAKSALLGGAFNIQNSILRICSNHPIQSIGGELNKELQLRMWDLQEKGIHPFKLRIQNIHDELQVAHQPELREVLPKIKDDFIKEKQAIIPLLGMTWKTNRDNWEETH